jgi:Tfp pilus assembly protein PilX
MDAISFLDTQRRIAVRIQRQKGVALITALMVLILISAIVVGMCWMVMTDQRLGGNNKSREVAFYGAEAGMEKMTTDVANQFSLKGSLGADHDPGNSVHERRRQLDLHHAVHSRRNRKS